MVDLVDCHALLANDDTVFTQHAQGCALAEAVHQENTRTYVSIYYLFEC
jgi:hypothetical protein